MRALPGLAQFRGYRRAWLRPDVAAGVTVAAYLIPQVMAYATVAGLSPVVGLWAAITPLAVYAVLGTSRQLSVGPESTTALLTAVALGPWPPVTRIATARSRRCWPCWSGCCAWWVR
ncbi:sulfate permease family protein [Nocardia ignorata]|uniref:Sulfate permease family protein n=1 Tax=Nocardia ignorata TaxID=145285 RepID=A0A4R6P2W0_NOCIG|nr:sulfate permease family protein [Nocardia ignorata]